MSPAGSSDRPPLSRRARVALAHIADATAPGEGIARERAVSHLVDEGFPRADAVDILEQLHDRGHVYVVDDEVFVTDRDDL